jgi:type VI protein secretion system component Hcp
MRGAGGGAGRSDFSPLTVSFDANSGLTSLLSNLTSGRHIDSLQLQGVSADGETIYDLRLGDVTVTQFQDSNGQDVLSFEYRQVSVTTTGQNEDGSLAEPETFSWDLAANRSGVDIPEPSVPTDASGGVQAQSYYLTIDGIAGGSNAEGHEGAFDVNGYGFDVSAIVSAMRGGGSGAGHTDFSPLTVNIDANAGLTSLLSNLASGRHIDSLQLQGVSADGETVYDLRLGDVTVTSYHDSNGQEMLSFDYRQVSVTTTGQNEDGSLAEPETFSWDRATGSSAPTIPEPVVPIAGASVGAPQSYYLTIDGIAGGSTAEGHVGAFDVEGYSFDVAAIVSAMRGGGGGAGRTDFSPLTVNLDANSDVTSLLSHAVNGSHMTSLQLQGVSADGETIYDLRLGDVTVTSFHDSNTGQDMLSFDYRQVSITTTGQNEDGSLAEPEAFSWDAATNQQGGVNIPEPHVPTNGVQLLNGNEADVVVGSPGGILTGPHPGHDQFVFTGDFGHNEITNFSPSDHIVLERSHFGNANQILEHYVSDDGHGNTVITDPQNPDNVIVLDHVSVEELDVTDFVLL